MRIALITFGTVAMALGLVWIVQQGGWAPWPLARFSLPSIRWLTYGAIPVLGGWTLLMFARLTVGARPAINTAQRPRGMERAYSAPVVHQKIDD
jgi:hypothetical protein